MSKLLQSLPEDVLRQVVAKIPSEQLLYLALTCKQLLAIAIEANNGTARWSTSFTQSVSTCKWVYEESGMRTPSSALSTAAGAGRLLVLSWLYNSENLPLTSDVMIRAAEGGHVDILEWLHTLGCPFHYRVFTLAASRGHLSVFKWARRHGFYPVDDHAAYEAARANATDILWWLRRCGLSIPSSTYIGAAQHGELATFNFLWDMGVKIHPATAETAAQCGKLLVLEWLRHREDPAIEDGEFCIAAAQCGHTKILKWWVEYGGDLLSLDSFARTYNFGSLCQCAAESGNLETLEWLHSQQCELSEGAVMAAAAAGNIPMLKWMLAQGCPKDKSACIEAAKHGETASLHFLHENEWPWDDSVLGFMTMNAAHTGQVLTLEWLHKEHQAPLRACAFAAIDFGRISVLKWLHESGLVELTAAMCTIAARRDNLQMLKFLRSIGCPWDEHTAEEVSRNPDTGLAEWVREQGCPE